MFFQQPARQISPFLLASIVQKVSRLMVLLQHNTLGGNTMLRRNCCMCINKELQPQ